MGCGATKVQSRAIQPHGNINSSVETCSVKQQNNTDNHCTVSGQEVSVDQPPQSQVKIVSDGDDQQATRFAEERDIFQLQESSEKRQVVENQQQHVNEQQVNNQQDIPRAGSINDEQDEVTRHQTDKLNVNQDLCDYEVSKRSSDNTGDAIAPVCGAIVDMQADTHNETLCNNLQNNPQRYCATARSLSQSPRIVSLQVELGFVSVTSADLDLLQSQWNPKGCDEILDALGISNDVCVNYSVSSFI